MGKPAKNLFYRYDKILSFNAFWNFIVGMRGNGKTFGAKERALKDAINKHVQFIYVRRYKEELAMAKDAFFSDIVKEGLFPDWDFRVVGKEAQMARVSTRDGKKREWQTIGFFVALSQAQSYKSVSFPNVKWIIYDEFILEKSKTQYLPREADVFLNFYSTVDRSNDRVRVLFLANAVAVANPYFIKFRIRPDEMGEYGQMKKLRNGKHYIACHFIRDDVFVDYVQQTSFGQFIDDTDYADYAVQAVFSDNHNELIEVKPSNALYRFTLETPDGTFSIWSASNKWYCQEKRPGNEALFTTELNQVAEGKHYLHFSNKVAQALRAGYNGGRVFFDQPATRNAFLHIFKR